jgi:hypothetical protein
VIFVGVLGDLNVRFHTLHANEYIYIVKLYEIYEIEVEENGYEDNYMFMEPLNKERTTGYPV